MKINTVAIRKLTAAFCFLLLGAALVFPQTSAETRRRIFEEVWNTINEKYYDASFNGTDWAKVKEKYRRRAAQISGENEFYALLDQMAGELRDSHTRVYSPARREERKRQKRGSLGITIREVEGAPIVFGVAPASEAERAGIKAGMRLVSVNDRKVESLIEEARRAVGVSSSERATRARIFSKILGGAPDSAIRLELLDAGGKKRQFSLTRRTIDAPPEISARILPSGAAYLKFSEFSESIEPQIREALKNFKDAPAMIVDLRGNRGGDGEMGLRFAGNFFAEKITVAKIVTRTGKPPVAGMPLVLETEKADSAPFLRPLVVLTDEATASTAELISNALQEERRAKIFGAPSCGCVLAFLDYKPLAGGGELTLSEFGFITPQNRKLEGAGVVPDEIVPTAIRDLQNGRDAALEAAEKYLAEQAKTKN